MIPERSGWRAQTLRRTEEFRRVYRLGKRIVRPEFVLFVLREGTEPAAFGVTASRRVGGAVCRNRSKRVLREAMRTLLPQIKAGCTIVVVARAATAQHKSTEVRERLRHVLGRQRLLRGGTHAR